MFLVRFRGADSCDPQGVAAWDHPAAGGQQTLARVDEGNQTLAEKRQNPMNVGDNCIHRFRQGTFRGHLWNEVDSVSEAVRGSDFSGEFNDSGGLKGVDASG